MSYLTDTRLMAAFLAILVKQLGGSAKIQQADLDKIAFTTLRETYDGSGNLIFTLENDHAQTEKN